MQKQRGMSRAVGLILWGTLMSVSVVLASGVEAKKRTTGSQAKDRATALRSAIWDTREIPVCWENPANTPLDQQGRAWTRQAVQETWERYSQLRFIGWQECTAQSRGIRIRIADEGPHVNQLGKYLDGMRAGMVVNFTFQRWGLSCAERQEYCIKAIAVHEFGHALSFAHEHNRPDAPAECRAERIGTDGDMLVTAYDLSSVMNYCNPNWSGNGKLSALDIVAVQKLYGAPRQELVVDLAGTVRFELASGAAMPAQRQGRVYAMTSPYPSGTEFHAFITRPHPAHVYAFGFDRLDKTYRIFPSDADNQATSAASGTSLVLPDKKHSQYVRMDTTTGTDYFCVLFARRPLPFATLLQRFEAASGPFLSRLQTALGADLVAEEAIQYPDTGGIGFTAESRGRTVVPIVVTFEHVHEEPTRDTTPPHIAVLTPSVRAGSDPAERGFDLTPRQVSLPVRGQALDASGIAEVVVNGQRAEVDAKGNFQTVVPLNDTRTLEIRATDTRGNRRDTTFTILGMRHDNQLLVLHNQGKESLAA